LAVRGSQLGGNPYYATGVLPPNDVTDSDGWTRVILDRQRIDQRSRETSPATRVWLEQRGLIDGVEEAGVQATSLSAEVFPLTLHRPWFEPDVFRNRMWRWEDEALSDGGAPPRGLLPAYVTCVVLVRKLQIELDVAPVAPPAILAAAAPSTVTGDATPQPPQLIANAPDKSRALTLRQFSRVTTGVGPPSLDVALALGPLGSLAVAFPAPVTFLSRRILDRIAAEQENIANEVARMIAERPGLVQRWAALEPEIKHVYHQGFRCKN